MIETRSDCVVTLVIGDRLVLYSKLPEYLLTSTITYPLIKESPSKVSGATTRAGLLHASASMLKLQRGHIT